jgi:alcohol dehydrogenase (cytochrome c)
MWGAVYKLDLHAGQNGRVVWKMDPGVQKPDRNRGVALWGDMAISVTGLDSRLIATNRDTGKIVWERRLDDQPDMEFTAAPLALKDEIVVGASGGDNGARDWLMAVDPKTGATKWKTFVVPLASEPGSQTWKDKNNAAATGGGALYVTGSYDPATNLTVWGTGNPAPRYDSAWRPGDNLYTDSTVAFDAADGRIVWWFQYTPNDNHDYDAAGSQILLDATIDGAARKTVAHADRNGFYYTLDRGNGQFLKGAQYAAKVTWTKGIDQKTGRPVDYDPARDVQAYNHDWRNTADKIVNSCPDVHGGTNFWPTSFSERTKLIYIAGNEGCADITPDATAHVRGKFGGGGYANRERVNGGLTAVDPATGEIRKRLDFDYPDHAGMLTTAGGLAVTALLDGTVYAFDDATLETLWRMNVGPGFSSPPMTYEVDGRQYIAILSGIGPVSKAKLARSPEMRDRGTATILFVFGL